MTHHTYTKFYLTPIALAIGVFFSCSSNDLEDVKAYTPAGLQAVRSTANVTYTFSDSAHVKNVLKAGQVDQYQDGDSMYSQISKGFELRFYTSTGELDGKLTARNGYIYNRNADMTAKDSVVFENKAGEKLQTEELHWNQDSATVKTNKFVTITRKNDVIMGKGLISNQNFSKYEILQPTGFIYLNEDSTKKGNE